MAADFLSHPVPAAFAHRGGAAIFPENSWRAFEHAVGLGYAYLETEARTTADGVLVAFHDKTLDRVTDRTGAIASLPAREVVAARIADTDRIPLLEDLVAAWPDVRFNIDLKESPAVGLLALLIRRTAAWDRVCVTSFSGARLRAFRRAAGRPVCMGAAPADAAALRSGVAVPVLTRVFASRWVRCAQLPVWMAVPRVVRRAHAAGLAVHAWTINDAAQMRILLDRGIDGIMSDEIETLRDVLTERGQWHPRASRQ